MPAASETTVDGFLGGRLRIAQPLSGFRSGLDAVLLAAAVPAGDHDIIFELGTGAGVAALCLASRIARAQISALEIDPGLAALAAANAADNGFASRVSVTAGDLFELPAALRTEFDHVFANPPFHAADGPAPPDPARARALVGAALGDWIAAGFARTRSGGSFTVILRAGRFGEALAGLPAKGITILPLWPKAGEPARRVLIQAVKASRAPLMLLPGLVLHETDGRYTTAAEAILSGGAPLLMARQPLL